MNKELYIELLEEKVLAYREKERHAQMIKKALNRQGGVAAMVGVTREEERLADETLSFTPIKNLESQPTPGDFNTNS